MTSQIKLSKPPNAGMLRLKQSKSAGNSKGLRRDYLVWAWEFLRRNPECLLYVVKPG